MLLDRAQRDALALVAVVPERGGLAQRERSGHLENGVVVLVGAVLQEELVAELAEGLVARRGNDRVAAARVTARRQEHLSPEERGPLFQEEGQERGDALRSEVLRGDDDRLLAAVGGSRLAY